MPNGQTPPGACPTSASSSSAVSIFALQPNVCRYFALSILVSPAVTTKIALSSTIKLSVFAMRAPWVCNAFAASSTVALDSSSSIILSRKPNWSKYAFTFSTDMRISIAYRGKIKKYVPLQCNYVGYRQKQTTSRNPALKMRG